MNKRGLPTNFDITPAADNYTPRRGGDYTPRRALSDAETRPAPDYTPRRAA